MSIDHRDAFMPVSCRVSLRRRRSRPPRRRRALARALVVKTLALADEIGVDVDVLRARQRGLQVGQVERVRRPVAGRDGGERVRSGRVDVHFG